jgi:hypothetical protein
MSRRIRARVPQRLLGVDTIPRSIRGEARRIDGHVPQPAQSAGPRQLHHTSEQIVPPLRVPLPESVQRPVIRRRPARQITKRQIFANALLQPSETIISGAYAWPPSSP